MSMHWADGMLGVLMGLGRNNYRRLFNACSLMLLLSLLRLYTAELLFYSAVVMGIAGVSTAGLYRSSHHFVVCLDMVALHSKMLPTVLQKQKITGTSSEL